MKRGKRWKGEEIFPEISLYCKQSLNILVIIIVEILSVVGESKSTVKNGKREVERERNMRNLPQDIGGKVLNR